MQKEQRFDTGSVEINYVEGPPSGPPLILLHGLATRWQIFRSLIRSLQDSWHIYALDFRGHGKSGHSPGDYGQEAFVEDTVAFIRAKVTEPAVLLGHSMGGWVAAGVAVRIPEAVRAIILVDTALYPALIPDDETLTALFGVEAAVVRAGVSGSIGAWPQSLRELDPDVMASYLDGRLVREFDADRLLPQIRCPVLLLQGNPSNGGFMTDEDVERALPQLVRARHVRFPDAGHWLHIQDTQDVVRETTNFLAAL